ncbi:hypothetical protein HHI36_018281 [Cryptolaemus montrouzieri]|uniref:Uncharacterized protein n=1 Tax=Cryptolaemus montrouzieri TaxID=559131 RepID=A0ABD2NZH6_9CUCU
MMSSKHEEIVPHAGRGDCSESRPLLEHSGCTLDSGEVNSTLSILEINQEEIERGEGQVTIDLFKRESRINRRKKSKELSERLENIMKIKRKKENEEREEIEENWTNDKIISRCSNDWPESHFKITEMKRGSLIDWENKPDFAYWRGETK